MALLVISYAREDQPQVRAIVALLRAAFRDIDEAVYWDDHFQAGEPWFEQLAKYIDKTPQLFVFWCAHSADSKAVRREYSYAEARGKRIVPILLDDTNLPRSISEIHAIDLRHAVRHARKRKRPVRLMTRSNVIRALVALVPSVGVVGYLAAMINVRSEFVTALSALVTFAVAYWTLGTKTRSGSPRYADSLSLTLESEILDYAYCDAIVEMFAAELKLAPERARL